MVRSSSLYFVRLSSGRLRHRILAATIVATVVGIAAPLSAQNDESLRILRQSSANGSAAATYALGARAEANGDMGEALNRYQQAALMGYVGAQYNLARLLEGGNGVPQDLMAAEAWYRKAAQANFAPAVARIQRLDAARQYDREMAARAGRAPAAPAPAATPAPSAVTPPAAATTTTNWTQIALYGVIGLLAIGALFVLPAFTGRRTR